MIKGTTIESAYCILKLVILKYFQFTENIDSNLKNVDFSFKKRDPQTKQNMQNLFQKYISDLTIIE